MVTVQVHNLNLTDDASQVVLRIPFLAVRLPAHQARPIAIYILTRSTGVQRGGY